MRLLEIYFFGFLKFVSSEFEVPDALVEVFKPSGLRVSIPDIEGIKLFAFHGQVNVEMNGREGGTFSRDITKVKNGRWTFYDPYAKLQIGDVLYYWTYVDYFDGRNKLGHTNDDVQYVVKELLQKETPNKATNNNGIEEATLLNECERSDTTFMNQTVCSKQLIFNEDFNSLREMWNREVKFAGSPDYEFVMYLNQPDTLQVKENHLKIRPVFTEDLFGKGFVSQNQKRDLGVNCTGVPGSLECVQKPSVSAILPPTVSAQITTKNKWSFKFGKIEIRARLPKGDWIYPELYLNPVNELYGPGYASGQIRIAFLGGNDHLNKNFQSGCILGNSRRGRNYGMKSITKSKGTWSDDFHTFTVLWKPDKITVSVDGRAYGNIFAPEGGFITEAQNLELGNVDAWSSGTQFAPFDKEMYLVIGVGVGGLNFEDQADGKKPWQNFDLTGQTKFFQASSQWKPTWSSASSLDVDYIKVWAL